MDTLPIIAMFFDRGAKATNELIKQEVSEGRLAPGALVGRNMLNLATLQLLAMRARGTLSEIELKKFVELFESAEISDGTRVVYAMLASDLAREAGVRLNLTKQVQASGDEIDWELLGALEMATPTFSKLAKHMIKARATQVVQKSDG